MNKTKEPKGEYKFNEDNYVEELQRVIDSTYTGHYSRQHFQATEFIIDGGHGTGFCIGNIMKYAQRYGKKGTSDDARKDLLKVLHYAIIQLYVHDMDEFDKCASVDSDQEYKYNGEQKSVVHYIYMQMVFFKKTLTRSKKDIIP